MPPKLRHRYGSNLEANLRGHLRRKDYKLFKTAVVSQFHLVGGSCAKVLRGFRFIIQSSLPGVMPYCAVPGCLNGSGAWGGTGRQEVKWFRFPKDPARSQLWWQQIKRDEKMENVKDPRVCSDHFTEQDYERDLKFELMNPGTPLPLSRSKLSPTSCPSRKIPSSHPSK